jgi:hypothetical protein
VVKAGERRHNLFVALLGAAVGAVVGGIVALVVTAVGK